MEFDFSVIQGKKNYFYGFPEKLCTRHGISWWLFGLFLFVILGRNIDCKSILHKTLNQFGLLASKYERKSRYKSNFRCVSLRRRVCFNMSRHMFLQNAFQFGFLSSKPCLFPLGCSLEFIIHRGKPSLLVCRLYSPPIDQSFCNLYNFHANCTAVSVFFFLNPAAEIMLSMLFNTLLKITPHNTQKRRGRKNERTK